MARTGFEKTILITILLIMSSMWIISTPDIVSGVSGSITTNTTWSGTVSVTGNVYIEAGVNLTINPGTFVYFQDGSAKGIFIAPTAKLYVNGASGNKVVFNKQSASWNGIILNASSSEAVINHAEIYNCINGIYAEFGGKLRVTSTTINNSLYGIHGDFFDPIIKDSHIHNNSFPIIFYKVNGTIYNTRFVDNTGAGILWLNSKGKPRFDNNHVIRSLSNGVEFRDSNPHITNNTIRNNTGHGLQIAECQAYVYKNIIAGNAQATPDGGLRLYADSSTENSIVDDNTFLYNGRGIIVERDPAKGGNVSSLIKNNEIKYSSNTGLDIRNATWPTVDNNDIMNNRNGVWVQKMFGQGVIIANSTITGNTDYDWYVAAEGNPTSLNSVYNTAYVTTNLSGQYLKVKWLLDVTVLEQGTGTPILGAEFTVAPENDTTTIHQRRLTDAAGKSSYMHVLEKVVRSDINVTYYSPFRLTADKIAFPRVYVANSVSNYTISSTKSVTIFLTKNLAPTAPAGIQPITTHDTTPRVQWSTSTDVNLDPITYYFKLGSTIGGGEIIPETPIAVTFFDIPTLLTYDVTYHVSLKAGDNRYSNSSWVRHNMTIKNNKPSMPTMMITPGIIYTDSDVTVKMTAGSIDDVDEINDYGESTRYIVYIDINDVGKNSYTLSFVPASSVDFVINNNDFSKGDVINITVIPYDGHGTDWETSGTSGAFRHPGNGTAAQVSLTVLNHAPDINQSSSDITDITMLEDTIYIVPSLFEEIFNDPDSDNLKFEYTGNANIDVDFNENTGQLRIIPKPNYFTASGKDQLKFIANDTSGGITELVVNVTVQEVNDLPIINVDLLQVAFQDKTHYINITLTDSADPHDTQLSISTNFTTLPFVDKITLVERTPGDITLFFTPSNDDIGIFYLNISGTDTKATQYLTLKITINNVNDKPHEPSVILPKQAGKMVYQIYNTTDELDFEASVFDPDLIWGDSLTFLWSSNISGLTLSNLEKFTTKITVGGHHRITVTAKDTFNAENSTYFDIFVINPVFEATPQTELIYPINNMQFPSTVPSIQLTLSWEAREHKYSDLFVYDLEYWIDDDTEPKRVNGLKDTEHQLTVDVDKTYTWWVIPRLGGFIGESFSPKWSFFVKYVTNVSQPTAKLLSPLNNEIIDTTTVDLEWMSVDENADAYFYRVFIDENPTSSTLVEDYRTGGSFTLTALKDKTVYYWNIIPVYGSQAGGSTNGPFRFEVNTEFVPNPEVTITPAEDSFDMTPSESKDFSYTIENTGNTIEELVITLTPDDILVDFVTKDFVDEKVVILMPGETSTILFSVNLVDMGTGSYDIRLRVISSDKNVSERKDITLNVKPEEEDTGDGLNMALVISLLIVVIIIIVVVVVMFLFKKKPKPDAEEDDRVSPDAGRPQAIGAVAPAPALPGKPQADAPPAMPAKAEPAKVAAPAGAGRPLVAARAVARPQIPAAAAAKPELPEAATPDKPEAAAEAKPAEDAKEPEGDSAEPDEGNSAKCPTCGSDIPAGSAECPICSAKIQ